MPRASSPATGRLLETLEKLLELPAADLPAALTAASTLVAESLAADKVDAFLYDPTENSLVALGTSDTPLGHAQRAAGMHRLPLVNGGKMVETYTSGEVFVTGHAERDGELRGITEGLGVRSELCVALTIEGARRGVLAACSTQADYFTDDDARFLAAVARWVGAVAHRAELITATSARATEEGRRLAAEELVTVLAHDLRNYLNPLRGRVTLLRMRAAREGRAIDVRDADAADRAVERLAHLVSDLLDVTRLEEGLFVPALVPMDLVAVASEAAGVLATGDVPVRVEGPAKLGILGDPARLRQVLDNLIGNAVSHSPAGTEVTVRLASDGEPAGSVARVEVADRGPGIPTEVLPHLFERFAVGPRSRGLGLGLHLARRIVLAHGGTLTVDAAPGEGARFQLRLPTEGPPIV